MMTTFKPIGTAISCYPDKFGTPRQPGLVDEATAFIRIHPEFQPELSLSGLDGFSHLAVIFVFHKNNQSRFHAKVHPPRLNGETIGLFATRSPHRPNPIGLSVVKIKEVTDSGVWVSGVDFINETPILDIKPYLPQVDAHPHAQAGWIENIPAKQILVEWDELALATDIDSEIKKGIEKSIQLDPRPTVYKERSDKEHSVEAPKYRDEHKMRFADLDVTFRFLSPAHARINEIKKIF